MATEDASSLISWLADQKVLSYVGCNDFSEKLHFNFTKIFIVIQLIIEIVLIYYVCPISCYLATDAGGSNLISYVEQFCWTRGVAPLHPGQRLPQFQNLFTLSDQNRKCIHQWMPFLFLCQLMLIILPKFFWDKLSNNFAGEDVKILLSMAKDSSKTMNRKFRDKLNNEIAQKLKTYLFKKDDNFRNSRTDVSHRNPQFCHLPKLFGLRIMMLYFLLKLYYIILDVLQIVFILIQFELPYSKIFQIPLEIFDGHDVALSTALPRVGFCPVSLRHVGASSNFAVAQCTLPINMFNEKFILLSLYWIFVLLAASLISVPFWIFRLARSENRRKYLRHFLEPSETRVRDEKHKRYVDHPKLKRFEKQILRANGIFLLQMIALNSNIIVTSDIVSKLWEDYKTENKENFLKSHVDYESQQPHMAIASAPPATQKEMDVTD